MAHVSSFFVLVIVVYPLLLSLLIIDFLSLFLFLCVVVASFVHKQTVVLAMAPSGQPLFFGTTSTKRTLLKKLKKKEQDR